MSAASKHPATIAAYTYEILAVILNLENRFPHFSQRKYFLPISHNIRS